MLGRDVLSRTGRRPDQPPHTPPLTILSAAAVWGHRARETALIQHNTLTQTKHHTGKTQGRVFPACNLKAALFLNARGTFIKTRPGHQ